jgi:sugar/nucleoside kinase (ribokinase family)
MKKAHVRLVTIVAASEVESRMKRELTSLGVTRYTVSRVDGAGQHGTSERGLFEDGNVRFDLLVNHAVADALLDRAAILGESLPLIAFAHDVEAVPCGRFEQVLEARPT